MHRYLTVIFRLIAAVGPILVLSGAGAAPLGASPEDRYVATRDAILRYYGDSALNSSFPACLLLSEWADSRTQPQKRVCKKNNKCSYWPTLRIVSMHE